MTTTALFNPFAGPASEDGAAWRGYSGQLVTSEQIARHMEAAATLMRAGKCRPDVDPALDAAQAPGVGDEDTHQLACLVLETLLKRSTGARVVLLSQWAGHPDRTPQMVEGLLRDGAGLVRRLPQGADLGKVLGLLTFSWYGGSGAEVTGDAVARHVEAAAALMESRGWDPQFYDINTGHGVTDALQATLLDGHGTRDTKYVAVTVMERLLAALLEAPVVLLNEWTFHGQRTLPDVLKLLKSAAAYARAFGPRA
ncbi:hypothetical protein [Streptomyces sp. NPDC014733]|uniref:DUF6197 family protein n=1 Tax=Streptomyces sp. NPDC014733 TaxID=3364885 RepID=UPI0036FD161E